MKTCLYCQHRNAVERDTCDDCAMPLPEAEARALARRLSRFQWCCLGLTLFCIAMFFWLPRDIY
ncbi:protein DnrP [Pseudomonas sp. QC2]|uniref:protein DnrP n=1 Tax=Pseudomonas sp. QC2 TaxID=2065822 RepID=UPI000C7AA3A9|nr:protein DnrP [Pseudomonas sp. QC2]PLR63551.1 protein DnrP [Pseudomonas sp. QC2]